MVTLVEVVLTEGLETSHTLCHVLAGHLEVHSPGVAAHFIVDVEEGPELSGERSEQKGWNMVCGDGASVYI